MFFGQGWRSLEFAVVATPLATPVPVVVVMVMVVVAVLMAHRHQLGVFGGGDDNHCRLLGGTIGWIIT